MVAVDERLSRHSVTVKSAGSNPASHPIFKRFDAVKSMLYVERVSF